MSYTFRKAVRENTSVLIAFAGESGSGKTYSALRFARGLVGEKGKMVLLDTEAGRALHYADNFSFDHLDMKPPFSPMAYTEAIVAAEQTGYGAIIVDSMSHEWAGDGGCTDMHDEALTKMAGDDAAKAERMNVLAWREPKLAHKRMVSRMLQCRAHLIFCLRAEEKIKFIKVEGKTKIEPAGWQAICEKNFLYEMTVSFMLHSEQPGYGHPVKLQEQHKPFFKLDAPLDEKAGVLLAQWASGGKKVPDAPIEQVGDLINADQAIYLEDLLAQHKIKKERFLLAAKVDSISKVKQMDYQRALTWIEKTVEKT